MAGFDSVSVGDSLIYCMRHLPCNTTIVKKITKTQLVCDRGRFRKSDGRMVGTEYGGAYVRIATDSLIATVEKKKLKDDIQHYMHTMCRTGRLELTDSEMKRLHTLLKKAATGKPNKK